MYPTNKIRLLRVVKGTLMQIWKSLYVRVHIKITPWKFRILNSSHSRVTYPKVCTMFVYKHTETKRYVKN